MRLTATPEDFLKGKLVAVGFHPAIIASYDEKMSKRQPDSPPDWVSSQYAEVQFKITAGPDAGTVIYQNFSEKGASFVVPLLEAITGKTIDRTKLFEAEINKASMEGKCVDIHVVRGQYKGKPKNEIDGYRPYTGPKGGINPST